MWLFVRSEAPPLFRQFPLPANDKQTQQPRNSRYLPPVSRRLAALNPFHFDHFFFVPLGGFSQHLNPLERWKYLIGTNTWCLTSSKRLFILSIEAGARL